MDINSILNTVMQIAVLLFAVTVHEVAHGWMAEKFGDSTARDMGRITLNPIAHLDPIGSIIFPAILAFIGAPVFGWAKPVPVNPYNLRDRKRANILISLAGPASNLLQAIVGIILILIVKRVPGAPQVVLLFLFYVILINIYLAIFNLIPIPPLDGSHVLEETLKGEARYHYEKIKPYGFLILMGVIYLGVLDIVARPVFSLVIQILRG